MSFGNKSFFYKNRKKRIRKFSIEKAIKQLLREGKSEKIWNTELMSGNKFI